MNIKEDLITRALYAVDASIHEVLPSAVAFPESLDELDDLVRFSTQKGFPIIPRGAGTGIAGGCLGEGIVIDCALHLNKIHAIDPDFRTSIVEPGVIQDQLNQAVAPFQLRLGPDTSTGDRATLGGMIANCAAGSRSLHYGTMREALVEVELLLSSGDTLVFKEIGESEYRLKLKQSNQEGIIYRAIEKMRTDYRSLIEKHMPPLPRRSSGYPLDTLLKPFPFNPAQLIAGSEGTLGIIKKAKVALADKLKNPCLMLIPCQSLMEAFEKTQELLIYHPIALELIDDKIMSAGKNSPMLRGRLNWLPNIPQALLVAEFEKSQIPKGLPYEILNEPFEMQSVWDLRKAGLGLLLSKRSYTRAIAFIEDLSIPPSHLTSFMEKFLEYLKSKGKEAGIYGHVGPGCLHIRPYLDLRQPQEIAEMHAIMHDVAHMIQKENGAMSGEHGDGLIRSWINREFFGEKLYKAFCEIKEAFDPLNLMNPHKITDPLPFPAPLRKSPSVSPHTFFPFDKGGGIALSVDLCNGNGACRKAEGVMCPSFQVTRNEYDSTRGRANTLRDLMRKSNNALAEQDLHEILDLCIQCKGCKSECPSQVDMAKMKSEALYHYGSSFRDRLFGKLDSLLAWGYPFRKVLNSIMSSEWIKKLAGIAPKKPLPAYAPVRFSDLWKKIPQKLGTHLLLMNDTYTEFFCPEVGIAAIKVLNALGFQVTVIPWKCCGRPALSKGLLDDVKSKAEKLIDLLLDQEPHPIIGLEPSCFFSFRDEYPDLFPEKMAILAPRLFYFDEWIAKQAHKLKLDPQRSAALHLHCHQRALAGETATRTCLQSLPHLKMAPSGCCGMAGSFGHELEHAAFSEKIAALKLFPFLDSLSQDEPLIANGFSCRSQIEAKGRKALHLAQFLENELYNDTH